MKRCYSCNVELVLDVNHTQSLAAKWDNLCTECAHAKTALWRLDNPDYSHKRNLRQYNLTPALYAAMAKAQSYCCALCKRASTKRRLDVDHDHITGRNRGLLCVQCNGRLIGSLESRNISLQTLIEYLERPVALGLNNAPSD
jgi:hypothetical protein